jgi:hypothetical protein
MAKKNIFIFRDENISLEKQEELQDEWLSENHPDKTIIEGEDGSSILLNEEAEALICMEYVDFVE